MSAKRENRVRGGTSTVTGEKISARSRRPPRSRLMPEFEQLPEAGDHSRSLRPRIQDRARAQALTERGSMSGYIGIDVSSGELVVAVEGVSGEKIYQNSDRGYRDLVNDLEQLDTRLEI